MKYFRLPAATHSFQVIQGDLFKIGRDAEDTGRVFLLSYAFNSNLGALAL